MQAEFIETKFFEVLENRSENESFCSTSSFAGEVVKGIKSTTQNPDYCQDMEDNNLSSMIRQHLSMNSPNQNNNLVENAQLHPDMSNIIRQLYSAISKYCTCTDCSVSIPTNGPSPQNGQYCNPLPYCDSLILDDVANKILQMDQKIKEYEREINNAKISKEQYIKAKLQTDEFLKNKTEEIENKKAELCFKSKQLDKERECFNAYSKNLRNQPTIVEQANEIKRLKEQVTFIVIQFDLE